ncbi:MAG: hypothetical protein VX893_09965 [Candidatus Latescibacterota bacterium]|nr:hypothetical protein [Candidatus Latescibacterota bacterium]
MKTRTDQQVRFISAKGICTRRAPSKQSDEVRWSMDLYYEATETATQSGKQFGFVARSGKEPAAVRDKPNGCLNGIAYRSGPTNYPK